MGNIEIIDRIVRLTENIVSGSDFNKVKILKALDLLQNTPVNLNIYKGILLTGILCYKGCYDSTA